MLPCALLALVLAAPLTPNFATAQQPDFPDRSIRMIFGFAPGGSGDIAALSDPGSFVEYGGSVRPALAEMRGPADGLAMGTAQVSGRPVDIVAYDYTVYAGTQSANNHAKISRMFSHALQHRLPVICWLDGGGAIDVPSFLIGSGAERSMLGRRSAKLPFEWAHATVPSYAVVLRKGYGLGYLAMCGGRSGGADASFAWPTAEICAMSIEGSLDVAYRRDYASAPDPLARRQELIEAIRTRTGALRAAEGYGVDDVIDSRDTRRIRIELVDQAPGRRQSDLPPKYRALVPV